MTLKVTSAEVVEILVNKSSFQNYTRLFELSSSLRIQLPLAAWGVSGRSGERRLCSQANWFQTTYTPGLNHLLNNSLQWRTLGEGPGGPDPLPLISNKLH